MCGSDGETYESICELEGAEGERFDYEGEACKQESLCSSSQHHTCIHAYTTHQDIKYSFLQVSVNLIHNQVQHLILMTILMTMMMTMMTMMMR